MWDYVTNIREKIVDTQKWNSVYVACRKVGCMQTYIHMQTRAYKIFHVKESCMKSSFS